MLVEYLTSDSGRFIASRSRELDDRQGFGGLGLPPNPREILPNKVPLERKGQLEHKVELEE
jgi:hypothetical protein